MTNYYDVLIESHTILKPDENVRVIYYGGSSMEKDQKHIWVVSDEPNDFKTKVVVITVAIVFGIAAFLACIYSIIPALLADV